MKKKYDIANHTIVFKHEVKLTPKNEEELAYKLSISLQTSGTVEVDGVQHQWEIKEAVDSEEHIKILYENEQMSKALKNIGYTQDQVDDICDAGPQAPLTLYTIEQYDVHFTSKLCEFGTFVSFDLAKAAMLEGLEKLYPGFKDDACENGSNQWFVNKFEFGINISQKEMNIFEEM